MHVWYSYRPERAQCLSARTPRQLWGNTEKWEERRVSDRPPMLYVCMNLEENVELWTATAGDREHLYRRLAPVLDT